MAMLNPSMQAVARALLGNQSQQPTSPFVWGDGGQALNPAQVKSRQAIVEALLSQNQSTPTTFGEGIAQLGRAGIAAWQRGQIEEAETAGRSEAQSVMDALLGDENPTTRDVLSAAANPWVADTPGYAPIIQALMQQSDPLRQQQLAMGEIELNNARNPAPPAPDYGFMELPGGRVVRTDGTSGNIQDMGQFGSPSPELTDTQLNLMWRASEAGLQPGTPEYQQFMMTGGQGGTSLNVGPDGTVNYTSGMGGKYGQTVSGGFGEAFMGIQNQALSAVQGMGTLDAMERAMADPNFYSGFGAEQLMGLKQAAAAMGINPDGVQSMETFNALSKKAALDAMGGSLGAGFSNADRGFVEQQVASMGTTPEGNRALIALQRKLGQRKIEIAQLANQYAQAKGGIDAGFTDFLAQWAEDNPLFPAATAGAGTVNTTGSGLKWSIGQ